MTQESYLNEALITPETEVLQEDKNSHEQSALLLNTKQFYPSLDNCGICSSNEGENPSSPEKMKATPIGKGM